MNSHIHKLVSKLPLPPEGKGELTPTQIVNSGTHTEEELMQVIERLIINGVSMRGIAENYNIELSSLSRWLSSDQRFTRTKTAMLMKADYHADMQLQVLTSLLGVEKTKEEIMLVTKISEAHRWAARTGNPSKYGEKLDVTSDNKPIVQVNLGAGIAPPLEVIEGDNYLEIEAS